MDDFEDADVAELKAEIENLSGTVSGLKAALAILFAEAARKEKDPEEYLMALLSEAGYMPGNSKAPEFGEAFITTLNSIERYALMMLKVTRPKK